MGYCLTKAKLSQGFSVAKHHCLANNNSQINLFVWDPTEPVATRPLFTTGSGNRKFFYTCDGNKNVSELVHFETRNGIAARYDYAPFGAVTRAISASAVTDNTFTTDNPFRFSSEYHDDTLGLVYYNYRHYNPIDGRWCGRDPIDEASCVNLFSYAFNSLGVDVLGCSWLGDQVEFMWNGIRLTGRVVTDATVATWNGAYYAGKVVQTYTGSFFMLEASLINGELFAEILGDDSHRYLDFSNEKGCNFNISINGMANKDGTAFRDAVEIAIQQKVYQLDNENTWTIPIVGSEALGVGDIIQSLWYEVGGQDLLSVHLAEAIQNANERGRVNGCAKICISVYAHSQGTMVARRGFDLLKYVLGANSDLANVTFCGYGGETSIDAEEFGLRGAKNYLHSDDYLIRILAGRFLDDHSGTGKHSSDNYINPPKK